MIYKTFLTTLIIFKLCIPPANSQDDKVKARSEIKATIERLNEEMEKAFIDNDMLKVGSFYLDDAEISGANQRVKGRKDLDNYWLALKDKGKGWKLDVIEVGGEGEMVYQLGKSDLKYMRQGAEVRSVVNFILLWKPDANGTYKIYRDYLTKSEFLKSEKK